MSDELTVVTIRDVPKGLWRRFRALVQLDGRETPAYFIEALEQIVTARETENSRKREGNGKTGRAR